MRKILLPLVGLGMLIPASSTFAQTDITSNGSITTQYDDSPTYESIEKLIDNQSNSKFLTFHNAAWVQFAAPSAVVINSYSLTSANDAPERDPLSWTLQASNDGNSWTTLDSRSGEDFASRMQKNSYSFTNTEAYSFFRLNLENNSGNILQLAELELFELEIGVSLFEHCDYDGYQIDLATGEYTTSELEAAGALSNDVSSLKVKQGFKITLFENDNFGGNSIVLSNDESCLVAHSWNDKTSSLKIEKDLEGWENFVYPTVVFDNQADYTTGSDILNTALPNIADAMREMCLEICKKIYANNADARVNFTKLNLILEDTDGVAGKWGSPPEIFIAVSANHLENVYNNNGGSYESVAKELKGILAHEGTHGYQWEPKNAGDYAYGTDFYGFIEGLADYVRINTTGFEPQRYPRLGGHWTYGYEYSGFFIDWLADHKDPDFAIKLNQSARDYSTWSWDSACQNILGESVQSLWDQYQAYLSANALQARTVANDEVYPNPASNRLYVKASEGKKVQNVAVYSTEKSSKTEINMQQAVDSMEVNISDLKPGLYMLIISNTDGSKEYRKFFKE